MKADRFSLLLLITLPIAVSAQPCVQPNLHFLAKQIKSTQSQLLAFKLQDGMDESVPAPLQSRVSVFKSALSALVDAAVTCAPANTDPKSLETTLAGLLDANKPEAQGVYDPNKPPQLDQIYGSDLRVKVTRPQNEPQILLVEFNFGIDCGFDSVLLAYEQSDGKWKQVLRWQSPAYDTVSGAFGDFFDYKVLPQAGSKNWLIVVAHGHPWCTSAISGFDIDLLQPSARSEPQKKLFHRNLGYRRDSYPVMKDEPDGFEFRMTTESFDSSIVIRSVIYRFQLDGSKLVRVQPISMNGRDFVEEWLESPWDDASRWSATTRTAELKQIHEKIAAQQDVNARDWPSFTFGPVRGCTDAKQHYQIELDVNWTSNGNSRPGNPTFFQIEEGRNSFTMLSAATNADSRCTGPDIMGKH